MKKIIVLTVFVWSAVSCGVIGSLNSNTSIKPHDRFVLGQNQHGKFRTYLKNEGVTVLKIFQAPIAGGSYPPILVNPQETVQVKTDKNTALVIENTGNEYASVTLKVKGDLNLGMTYQQP